MVARVHNRRESISLQYEMTSAKVHRLPLEGCWVPCTKFQRVTQSHNLQYVSYCAHVSSFFLMMVNNFIILLGLT